MQVIIFIKEELADEKEVYNHNFGAWYSTIGGMRRQFGLDPDSFEHWNGKPGRKFLYNGSGHSGNHH
jgi:hypothetical protein